MSVLRIILEGDGSYQAVYPGRSASDLVPGTIDAVTALDGGTLGGDPSVSFFVSTKDGRVVFAETTLKLFLTAADALKARYGDPRR